MSLSDTSHQNESTQQLFPVPNLAVAGAVRQPPRALDKNGRYASTNFAAQTTTPDKATVQHVLPMIVTRYELRGELKCVVSSAALDEPIVKKIELDVKVPPNKISVTGVGGHATQGTLLTLMCEVSGARPAAHIEWYNGTQKLIQDDNNIQTTIFVGRTNEPDRSVKYHDHTEDRREVEAIPCTV
ncbi:hypothetical protein RR48_03713 [Papilio machaon]|uniref:Ig-like domain-containing protein n=1 Tax=Papilio machaon TaxID=76193 RepID=A0A0N1I9P6_PAPMA|nr:hypothetical protein RR48_03713 [Papilio machaon]